MNGCKRFKPVELKQKLFNLLTDLSQQVNVNNYWSMLERRYTCTHRYYVFEISSNSAYVIRIFVSLCFLWISFFTLRSTCDFYFYLILLLLFILFIVCIFSNALYIIFINVLRKFVIVIVAGSGWYF